MLKSKPLLDSSVLLLFFLNLICFLSWNICFVESGAVKNVMEHSKVIAPSTIEDFVSDCAIRDVFQRGVGSHLPAFDCSVGTQVSLFKFESNFIFILCTSFLFSICLIILCPIRMKNSLRELRDLSHLQTYAGTY